MCKGEIIFMKKIHVFISQPMNGLKLRDINERREVMVQTIAREIEKSSNLTYKVDFDIEVDNPVTRKGKPIGAGRVWYLGQAISDMDKSDVVIFDTDAMANARGCKIEYFVATEYKKPTYVITSPILGEIKKYLR